MKKIVKLPKKIFGIENFLPRFEAFVFDCDGVIWKGDSMIASASNVITSLRKAGKKLYFVTNNSTKSRRNYLDKFSSLGITVFQEAAAYFEKNPLPSGKKVYVVGQQGICDELSLVGVPHIGGPADSDKKINFSSTPFLSHDPDVAAVVVGVDTEINYYKLQYAQLCINQNPGCVFIATNLDQVGHFTQEQEWAGGGAMVGAVKGCTGKSPILVGKPSSFLVPYLSEKSGVLPSRMCMVGDRLDTDIEFGRSHGMHTILTLSGVTSSDYISWLHNQKLIDSKISGSSQEEFDGHESISKNKVRNDTFDLNVVPDYYVDSIADFYP